MSTTSGTDAAAGGHGAAPRMFRVPLAPRLLSLFAVVVIGLTTVAMGGFAVLIVFQSWGLGLFFVALACFIGALAGYVGRDLVGKWNLWLRLEAESVTLNLPAGRSLIHRPQKVHLVVPYADIAAIETRLEAYRTLGMAMMQRAYVLRRKNDDLIFLFEDRALNTGLASSMFSKIAADLAARAGGALLDRGMVEGKGGVLGVWGTHAPDWGASPLPLALQMRLWRHSAITGSLAFGLVIVAIVLRLIVGG